ncbi:MAG: class I SAM-dependent methyltransferase [Nitrospirota bacterium]
MNILDEYINAAPTHQTAIDIFKGEWLSKLPGEGITAGDKPLFDDARIPWTEEQLGSFKGLRILELGPYEAAHTYMMDKRDADYILAIEMNTRSFLKCLIVKEIYDMRNSHFMLGNFIDYLKNTSDKFDICIASGVLYHMINPAELIYLISRVSDKVMLWTHYYDKTFIEENPTAFEHFNGAGSMESEYMGFSHILYKYYYQTALDCISFCGGSATYSYWMTREDVLMCLKHFGYGSFQIGFDHTSHPHGPAFCVTAIK